jgi:Ankyrin repeats (many copies)
MKHSRNKTFILIGFTLFCLVIGCGLFRKRLQPKIQNELTYAAYDGNKTKIKELIEKGADINGYYSANIHEDIYVDFKIFNSVIEKKNQEIIEFLIDNGANVNSTDRQNVTPLSVAVSNYSPKIVDLLIKRGAEVNFENHNETALDIADTILFNYRNDLHQKQNDFKSHYDCAIKNTESTRSILIAAGGKRTKESNKLNKAMLVPQCIEK